MRPWALVIAGPTAAGKSDLAVELAASLGWPVISADAMQVYRGMDIGTGKLRVAERRGVPHHGIDVVDPGEAFDAADFVRLADAVLAQGPAVVCGGTSMYLKALQRGLVPTPPVDPALRDHLAALPDPHAALAAVDPVLAARLHPHDHVRVLRGLEVHAASGERLSALQEAHAAAPDRCVIAGVWLDRGDLDARIDRRVEAMVADGYVDEVRRLLDAGVPREAKPMLSLGYRHLTAHLLDGLALDEAVRRTQRDTRRFAHKQRTWRKQLPLEDAEPSTALARLRAAAARGTG